MIRDTRQVEVTIHQLIEEDNPKSHDEIGFDITKKVHP